VLPARERFHPEQPAGRELDDRLVVQDQLVTAQRLTQIVAQLQPVS
jgi:hypothetical protein